MARIKINDLPKGMEISEEELNTVRGGALTFSIYQATRFAEPLTQMFPVQFVATIRPPAATGCGCMGMSQDPKTILPG
jgi:hypothetical protein